MTGLRVEVQRLPGLLAEFRCRAGRTRSGA
jgi:hypothetical protein